MPGDTLFSEATSALSSAGSIAGANADRNLEPTKTLAENSRNASSEIGAERRQQLSGEQAQKLAMLKDKLDQASNMVTITPQIALGLAKNTGDKEWLKMGGPGPDGRPQKMRSDVLLGLYQYGIRAQQAKRAPKITQIYDKNGKIRHSVVYTDDEGNEQQLMLDEGITPENLNKGKGGGKGGGAAGSEELKKMKEFNRAFEKARGLVSDASKNAQLKATDPEKYAEAEQFVKDNQDQYDANIKALGKGGGAAVPGASAGGSSAVPGDAPFDVDQFIKDATKTQ